MGMGRALRQIRQVQGALIEGVNETNRILVDKLDLLRATPSVEETRGGRPEEEHAESSTGQAIEFLGENYEKKPEEQPKENPEEPSEKQSHTQSNEHSRPHSKSSSKSSNPPTPPVGGTPLNEGSSQPAGSFPTFSLGAGMTARLAPINHQLTALTSSQSLPLPQSVPLRQSVPSLPSQFSLRTQIRATREELVKELDRFIRFEKIQPSQWSGLVLLLALFLLGRQGVTTEFERAQAKEIKGQGRREDRSSMEDGDSSGAGSIWNARRNTMHSDRFQVVVGSM
jgi:hypothetical protein